MTLIFCCHAVVSNRIKYYASIKKMNWYILGILIIRVVLVS